MVVADGVVAVICMVLEYPVIEWLGLRAIWGGKADWRDFCNWMSEVLRLWKSSLMSQWFRHPWRNELMPLLSFSCVFGFPVEVHGHLLGIDISVGVLDTIILSPDRYEVLKECQIHFSQICWEADCGFTAEGWWGDGVLEHFRETSGISPRFYIRLSHASRILTILSTGCGFCIPLLVWIMESVGEETIQSLVLGSSGISQVPQFCLRVMQDFRSIWRRSYVVIDTYEERGP